MPLCIWSSLVFPILLGICSGIVRFPSVVQRTAHVWVYVPCVGTAGVPPGVRAVLQVRWNGWMNNSGTVFNCFALSSLKKRSCKLKQKVYRSVAYLPNPSQNLKWHILHSILMPPPPTVSFPEFISETAVCVCSFHYAVDTLPFVISEPGEAL